MSFEPLEFKQEAQFPTTNENLKEIVRPHVDSFNSLFDNDLLELAVMDIPKITMFTKDNKSKMVILLIGCMAE